MCNNGTLKQLPTKISMSRILSLKCNSCRKVLKCFNDYEKFEITKNACSICGIAQVKLNYASSESPFLNQANQHTGCIYCDKEVKQLIEFPDSIRNSTEETKKEEKVIDQNKLKPKENASIIIVTKKKGKKGRR